MNNRYRTALYFLALVFFFLGSLPYPQAVSAQTGTNCPGALPSRLVPGEGGRVTPGAPNNVRNQPSTGAQKVGEIQAGTEFEVLAGPVCADGYAWWKIQYYWDKEGWTVESAGGQYALELYPTLVNLDGNEITYENLTFSFDPALGSGVKVKVYEPFLPSPQTPDFAVRPNDTRITLRDYPVMHRDDWSGDEPVIWVFPANEYANLVDMADQTIIKMREYLRQADSLPPSAFTGEEIVPALPLVNANMIFQAHRQALQFQNGTGFRFVTAYGQNIVAIDGYNIIYSFQGLTTNGQYWISVQFPVEFTPPADFPPESDLDYEHPEVYYEKALELLQAMPSSAFTPDLELLDAMVGSMFVTGGGDRLEPAPTTTEATAPPETTAAQSANDGLIAFVSTRDGNPEIYVMNADGSDQRRLTTNTKSDDSPTWSLDGRWIAFSQNPEYGGGSMFIVGANGTGLQPLPYDKCATRISWSPDGAQVAYASNGCGMGMSRLRIMNADGSTVQTAALNETNTQHSPFDAIWSPDGTRIALSVDDGIYSINPDGSNLTPLVTVSDADFTSMFLTQPVWSPDSSQLAFTSGPDIYLVNSDGSDLRLFPYSTRVESVLISQVDWSPDGTRLAFASDHEGNWEIYTANLDGSDLQRLTYSPADDYSPAWQPQAQPGVVIQLPVVPPTLFVGGQAQVQVLDDGLKLRSDTSTNAAVIEKMPNGTIVTILDGPRSGQNYTWWNVRTPGGSEGWAVESADDLQTLVPLAPAYEEPSTPEVTAETPAVVAPSGEAVFSDTFDDNTADWKTAEQEGLSAGIQDGKYVIDLTTTTTFQDWVFAPGYTNWAVAPQVQPPFEFEFEFSNVQSDTENACLAVFMGVTEKYATYTMLSVCQDGSWSISELKEGSLQPLGTSGFNMPVRILDGNAHKLLLHVEPGGPPGWNLYRFTYDDQPLGELLLPGQLNEGTVGFGITSFSSDPVVTLHAEFDNVVVRQLEATPSAEPAAPPAAAETINCTVSAGGANIRSGPGTNYNSIGTLSSSQAANGQRTGADGFVWWQLASGGWVRSDVVTEQGECERLPLVSPESPASAAPSETEPSLPRSYTSTSEKLTFAYPAGWFVSEGSGVVILSNNPVAGAALLTDSDWSFNRGEIVVLLIPADPGLIKRDLAKEIVQTLGGTADVVESIQVGDQLGVVASGSSDSADILSIVFDLPDGRILSVAAVTLDGEMDPYMSTIGAIALSVRAVP